MASSYSNTTGTTLAAIAVVTSSNTDTVWTVLYRYLQIYAMPVIVANALIGNTIIILLTLTANEFSQQTSFSVRTFYMSFAIADLVTVISYNLISWLGVLCCISFS